MTYKNILVEKTDGVGVITLNRPDAMNALSQALMEEMTSALDDFEAAVAAGHAAGGVRGALMRRCPGTPIRRCSRRPEVSGYIQG